ncbi:MAG TPA: NFACT family protein [Chloroflexota bacterium]|jgi:predicted ribosome quality control (RQC) complex YloA/Tae2 family protein
MSFDALTLSAVRDELEPLLVESRMQRLVFLDELSLVVEYFGPGVGRGYVLLSAHAEHGRVQRLDRLPARGLERDTPFSLVARKHLRNARIRSLRQPPLERVLELDCEQRDVSGQHYKVLLIVEAMGRRSNLILVDEQGVILDAARRSPPSRNARRPVLPHLPYVDPPPQDRLLPSELTVASLSQGASGRLAAHLGQRVAGLSPQAARELAQRATGSVDTAALDADWPAVLQAIHAFLSPLETHTWLPTLAVQADRPIAYAPYALTHLAATAEIRDVPSISAAMDAYYAEAATPRRGDALAGERPALLAIVEREATSLARRIHALEQQLENGQVQRDPLRRAGELILTHQAELPVGASELAVHGETIALDPTLSASENAQAYFARYRKAREAEERVPLLLDEARQQAAHLADLRTMVEIAPDMSAIRALRREIRGGDTTPKRGKSIGRPVGKTAPYRRVPLGDRWEALIGTSAAGNAAVTFDLAGPDDLWLHARGVPGAHLILRGSNPPNEVLEHAAAVAAWHSAARSASAVEVDIAPRRHVRKIPNGPPGLVRYANERTIRVTPKAP